MSNPERPRDYLDDVFDRFAEPGRCAYCGDRGPVRPEPFGHEDACKTCWDQIVGGE